VSQVKLFASCNLTIRNYRPEDLPHILELADYTLAQGPHFVRDEGLLKHLIRYSHTREGRVFVATAHDEIKGLAIVLIELGEHGLRFGNIVELEAIDVPTFHALIQACHKYSISMDVDAIITAPPPGITSNSILNDWLPFETGVMMGRILSFPFLLEELLRANEREMQKHFLGKSFVFRVDDECVKVESTGDKVTIGKANAEPEGNDIVLTMSHQAFSKIILCRANLLKAWLTRKVKIKGTRNVFSVFRLLGILRLTDRVYVSNADRL